MGPHMSMCVSGTERTFSGMLLGTSLPCFCERVSQGHGTPRFGQAACPARSGYSPVYLHAWLSLQWILGIELKSLHLEGKNFTG